MNKIGWVTLTGDFVMVSPKDLRKIINNNQVRSTVEQRAEYHYAFYSLCVIVHKILDIEE